MGLLDLVFPKTCLGCNRPGRYICTNCLTRVELAIPICTYCQRFSMDGITHIKCQRPHGLDGFVSIWEYEGVVRKAILALKYKYATAVAGELVGYLVKQLQSSSQILPRNPCLAPIPLHWHRQNVRGFNQSIEVGSAISKAIGWQFMPDLLIKKQPTISQAELKGNERRQNLKGVFAINSKYKIPDSVILFDDVFTTGSTLKESARVLKVAGVDTVWGLTIAR